MSSRRRLLALLATGAIVLAAALILAPALGSTRISIAAAFAGESPHKEILFHARLPRVLLAALAGGALSVAGLLFQALVRDSLADPYTLGIASGASLAAAIKDTLSGLEKGAAVRATTPGEVRWNTLTDQRFRTAVLLSFAIAATILSLAGIWGVVSYTVVQRNREIALRICKELTVHATVEEELFYPFLRENIEETDLVDEAEVEHATAKDLIAQIEAAEEVDDMFDAKVKVLKEYSTIT